MKRTGLLAFLFTVTACSGFGASDEGGSKPGPAPAPSPATDTPVAPPLDGKPTVDELTEDFGVFVTSSGASDGDGSRAHPVGTIGKGIELAKAKGKRVYVCAGTYAEALVVADGIPIAGGLDCSVANEWKPSDARSRVTSPTSPAVTAKAIAKATRIDHLEIVAPDASTPSGSSIGLLAVDAGGLVIASSKITAGKGMKGDDGAAAIQLTQIGQTSGAEGAGEKIVTGIDATILPAGKAGGLSTCAGVAGSDGGKGGTAGTPGLYVGTAVTITVQGQSSTLYSWTPKQAGYGAAAGEAKSGRKGQNGQSGPSATTWGTIDENGFTPADGTRAQDGMPGEGGKGGDSKPPAYPPQYHVGETEWGNAGSGGGAGGCPGLAGGAGKGGGASIAVVAIRSAMTIDGSELVASDAGAGGKGTFPSGPTTGGSPGLQHMDGTGGSPGGDGGEAGWSGSGAGGPSIAIAHAGGEPTLTTTTTTVGKPGSGVDRIPMQTSGIAASPSGIAEAVHKLD